MICHSCMRVPRRPYRPLLLSLALLLWQSGGCAVDERTGPALADALADGPVRDYAGRQADTVAQTSLLLQEQAAPVGGAAPDLAAARQSWLKVRAAYERGLPVFLVVAAELDFHLDGHLDDALVRTGLRQLEPALFATPPAGAAELARLTRALSDSALALHLAVPDRARPLPATALLGSMAAVAALSATRFDGSLSPYAGASQLAVEHSLLGLQQLYAPLSPLVAGADAALDAQLQTLLADLLAQVRALPSLDSIPDKTVFLRQFDTLSQGLRRLGTVLGLTVTTVNLS